MVELHCSECGSPDVGRARRRTTWDRVLSFFGVFPYRCLACSARFYRARSP
jgi:hypothetical protein